MEKKEAPKPKPKPKEEKLAAQLLKRSDASRLKRHDQSC